MAIHDNLNSLQREIEQKIMIALENDAIKTVQATIHKYLQSNLYNYTPEQYNRTYELFDSLITTKAVKVGDSIEVSVYFDTDLINPYPTTGQHYQGGRDISDAIPWMAEKGEIYPHNKTDHKGEFVKDALNELESHKAHVMALKQSLSSKGLKVI